MSIRLMPQWWIFTIAFVVMNFIGIGLLQRWSRSMQLSIHQTAETVGALDRTLETLSSAEDAHRGFLSLGDPHYAGAFSNLVSELQNTVLPELLNSVSDIPAQYQVAIDFDHAVRDRLARLQYIISHATPGDIPLRDVAMNLQASERSAVLVRELGDDLVFEEQQRRNNQEQFYLSGLWRFTFAVAFGSVLLMFITYWAMSRVRRELLRREQAEAAARESERLERERAAELQTLLDTVPAVVLIAQDKESRIVTGSKKAYETLRLPLGANTSKTAIIAPPQHFRLCRKGVDVPLEELPIQIAASTGQAVRYTELEIVFKDGSVRHLIGSAEPLFDDNGKPRGAIAAFTDITARREADLLLQASDARWKLSLEFGQLGFFEYDYEQGTTRWNESEFRIIGLDPSSTVPTPERFFERVHPDDLPRVRREWEKALDNGLFSSDFRIVKPDGEVRWLSGRGRLIQDSTGRKRWFTGVNIDITKGKRIEEDLSRAVSERTEALNTLNAFVQAAPIGIAVFDPDYRYRIVNRPLAEMAAYPYEKHIGRTIDEVVPEISKTLKPLMKRALEKGEYISNFEFEAPNPARPGEQGTWVESWFPIVGSGQEITGVGVVVQDITDRKRAERELADHRDRLQELVELRTKELADSLKRLHTSERLAALGTLAAGLGHDLANLVLPIRARLESLSISALTPEMRGDVVAIGQALDHLSNLSAGMRLMALDPTKPRAASDTTDLRAWWNEAQGVFRGVLPRHVSLEGEVTPGLGVAMPRHQFLQAIFNLVQNAGEILSNDPDGLVRIDVVPDESDSGFVLIRVSDNGPGMTAEVRARCFEPYFSTKGRAISTGMGLSLVRGLVEQNGGSIGVESEVGCGATFTIRLPRSAVEQRVFDRKNKVLQSAAVSLSEARQAALVTMIAQRMAVSVEKPTGDTPPNTEIWITDTAPRALVEHYLGGGQGRKVIYLGGRTFDPSTLQRSPEFESRITVLPSRPTPGDLRDAIGKALEGNHGEVGSV